MISDGSSYFDKGSIQFCLSVKAEPELKLSRDQKNNSNDDYSDEADFYVLQNRYKFSCEITGNPEPEYVTWIICDESENNCRNVKKYKHTVSFFLLFCCYPSEQSFLFY